MLFKRLNGEFSDEEYNRFFIERKGREGVTDTPIPEWTS